MSHGHGENSFRSRIPDKLPMPQLERILVALKPPFLFKWNSSSVYHAARAGSMQNHQNSPSTS